MTAPQKRLVALCTALAAVILLAVWFRMPARSSAPAHLQARPDQLAWFRDAGFGLMITWGPASLAGTEIGWSRQGPRRGQDKSEQGQGTIPQDVYDSLYERFDAPAFDADAWMRLAREAGARYVVFVTKHHDGFCMFDSTLTDYKVTNAPLGRDVTAEIARAAREAGLRLGFYYSQVDWHHPDYRTDRHDAYVRYLHAQIRELCTRYGQVDIIWFDGLLWPAEAWDSDGLFRMLRELQPGVLINDRAGLPADFSTLETEQVVGAYDPHRMWETCMPLGEQWSYKPDDRLKSSAECIRTLVRCAGAGGNLLLNIGPTPEGRIEPEQAERLRAIGAWLETHGESIYATRAGPIEPTDWGLSTQTDSAIYLHVLEPVTSIEVPRLNHTIAAASILGGGQAKMQPTDAGMRVEFDTRPHDVDTVIKLDLQPSGSAR